MKFENVFYLDRCDKPVKFQVLNLLKDNDKSFCPPLSKRTFFDSKFITQTDKDTNIIRYYRWLLDSSCILVKNEKDAVIGFVAYTVDKECLYIKNILVDEKYRNRGIASKLYSMILEVNRKVRIRTWSTNLVNIRLLKKNGFTIEEVIKDDRGEGIDTIFFVREKSS